MLFLPATLHDQIVAHLQSGYPDEACGFLLGRLERKSDGTVTKTVSAVLPIENRSQSPRSRFAFSPDEAYRADKAARQAKIAIVGVFHSHPDAPARPSAIDRQWAWADYSYLIVPVYGGQAEQAVSWVLPPDETGPFIEERWILE